jgi:hypothetical protein
MAFKSKDISLNGSSYYLTTWVPCDVKTFYTIAQSMKHQTKYKNVRKCTNE